MFKLDISRISEYVNAVIDGDQVIGLSASADTFIAKEDWYILPESAFKKFALTEVVKTKETEAAIKLESYADIGAALENASFTFSEGQLLTMDGGVMGYKINPYTEDELVDILTQLVAHKKFADTPKAKMHVACNYLAIVHGLIAVLPRSECFLKDALAVDLSAGDNIKIINAYRDFIADNYSMVITILLAGAVNHYATNHVMGGMDPTGFIRKIINAFDLETKLAEKGKPLAKLIYACIHSSDRRNGLVAAGAVKRGLLPITTLGLQPVRKIQTDPSITLRFAGLPAGAKKLDVARALIRYACVTKIAHLCGTYVCFGDVIKQQAIAQDMGVMTHIGRNFYTYRNPKAKDKFELDMSNAERVIAEVGAIIRDDAPDSTLARSPILVNLSNATLNIPNVHAVRSLRKELTKRISSVLADVSELFQVPSEAKVLYANLTAMLEGKPIPSTEKEVEAEEFKQKKKEGDPSA